MLTALAWQQKECLVVGTIGPEKTVLEPQIDKGASRESKFFVISFWMYIWRLEKAALAEHVKFSYQNYGQESSLLRARESLISQLVRKHSPKQSVIENDRGGQRDKNSETL